MNVRIGQIEAVAAKHAEQPGHSGHSDLLSRVNRLELGVASTLVGVVILVVNAFVFHVHN